LAHSRIEIKCIDTILFRKSYFGYEKLSAGNRKKLENADQPD